jgi:hypothetical protein
MTQQEIDQLNTMIAGTDATAEQKAAVAESLNAMVGAPLPAPVVDAPAVQIRAWALKYGFFILAIIGFIFDIASPYILPATYLKNHITDPGLITAVSFLFLMVGLIFYFPDIICDANGGPSTMRIVVLIVMFIFSFIYIKVAREAGTLTNIKIDQSWIYIIGLAFGSKVFQKFAENDAAK